jgi:HEAT repeat protein
VYALARFEGDGVPHLMEVLRTDKDPGVLWAVVDTLDTIGTPSRPAIALLTEAAVTGPTTKVRNGAVIALLKIHGLEAFRKDPPRAVPGLIDILRDQDPETRWGAVQTLAAIGPDAKEAVPDLTRLLKDSDLTVAQAAQFALRRIEPKP